MLAKRHRLTTKEFNQAFKRGERHHHPLLQLIVTPSPTFHAAVVVGKKVHKTAVARNRLRRQLYATLYTRHHESALPHTYLVIVKPAAATVPAPAIKSALLETLTKT